MLGSGARVLGYEMTLRCHGLSPSTIVYTILLNRRKACGQTVTWS